MIYIDHLTAGYEKEPVLHGINLEIKKGGITTIIGPNGCGKSTLLKCMARQMPLVSGDISIFGQSTHQMPIKEFAKKVSFLKQTRDVPSISAQSLVLHGRFPYMGFPRRLNEQDKNIAKNAMQRTGIWELRNKMLPELSGGECQKVYIAMALAQSADILLLDEPTTYLDIKYQLEILNLLCELKSEGKTVVTVLHDINSAMQISDTICVINKGRAAFCGTCAELISAKAIDFVFDVSTSLIKGDDSPQMFFKLNRWA